jgi:hypothetical protein
MNTVISQLQLPWRARFRAVATLTAWRRAIGSLGPTPWKWAGLIALFGILLECTLSFAELPPNTAPAMMGRIAGAAVICWGLHASLVLCAWAIADRVEAPAASRPRRLAVALCAAVLLQAVIGPVLQERLVGRLDPCLVHDCEGKDWSKVPGWLLGTEQSGQTLIFGALLFAWLEMQRRNREIEAGLAASQQDRARLQRSTFEARLTAMQAQVDPQFLFDCLAAVQSEYRIDTARGAAMLDRLITYLRAALPRLRSEGSTIGAETELVGAWLDVVASRGGGRPTWTIDVAADCVDLPFCATLLLPLAQWAIGELADPPASVALCVGRTADDGVDRIRARLRIEPARQLSEREPLPQRVLERLQALYGESARLSLETVTPTWPQPGGPVAAACLSLSWIDESTDRDRR